MDVSIDANIFEVIKIKATGKLKINTTHTVHQGIQAKSFYLELSGSVKLLEVIKMSASFIVEVAD